jgi:hypothetical protein
VSHNPIHFCREDGSGVAVRYWKIIPRVGDRINLTHDPRGEDGLGEGVSGVVSGVTWGDHVTREGGRASGQTIPIAEEPAIYIWIEEER